MSEREPTDEEAHAAFDAVEALVRAIPLVCEDRTNISLGGFISLLFARLTQVSLDSHLLDMDRIKDATDAGLRRHINSHHQSDTIN